MRKTSTSDALKALASGTDARSETAKLRDVFDDVENALKAGVKRQAVLETLKDGGINLTLKGFDTALHRIRKQRKKEQEKTAATPQSVTPKVDNEIYKTKQQPQLSEETPETKKDKDVEDFSGLTDRQKNEIIADQYIKPENTNPILRKILENKK